LVVEGAEFGSRRFRDEPPDAGRRVWRAPTGLGVKITVVGFVLACVRILRIAGYFDHLDTAPEFRNLLNNFALHKKLLLEYKVNQPLKNNPTVPTSLTRHSLDESLCPERQLSP
jgi:hypothetical protein